MSTLIFGCSIIYSTSILAQTSNEAKTLFKSGNPISTEDIGFFIAPKIGMTQLDGDNATIFNLRGGLNLKDKFSVGAYFNTSINDVRPQSETLPNIYMDYWAVGGFAEYTLFSKKAVHLTFPLYFGFGEVQMDNENGDAGLGEATFFNIEPSALIEINLLKQLRFNIGAGYRFVEQMNYRNFDQSEISGLTGYVGLKFGLFK
ncbi:MAG: hypothetical protein RIA69_05285 [Cyclobacteriaceae bacterium]